MSAPLQIWDYTGWDYMVAGDVANGIQAGVANWSGSVASMQTGYFGGGQCIREPSNLKRTIPSRYDAIYVSIRFRKLTSHALTNLWWLETSGGGDGLFVYLTSGGKLEIGSLPTLCTSNDVFELNRWYQLEVLVYLNGGAGPYTGKVRVRVDGAELTEMAVDNVKTWQTALGSLDHILMSASNLDLDDLIIKVGMDGFSESDWMSGARVIRRYANADGSLTPGSWLRNSGTSAYYTYVNDAQGNGSTDYIYSTTASDEIRFETMDVLVTDAASVVPDSVRVIVQAQTTNSTSVGIAHRIVQPTDKPLVLTHPETHGSYDKTAGWRHYHFPWPYDPEKFSDWTYTSLTNMEVGVRRGASGTGELRVSQVLYEAIVYPPTSSTTYTVDDLSLKNVFREATCWEITRQDGFQIYLTSADSPLTFDGKTYIPAPGGFASAERQDSSLRDSNRELVGALTSDLITDDDLYAGRYRQAQVISFVVDWMYPWAGRRRVQRFFVGETRWNGKVWEVDVNGVTRIMARKIGDVVSRTCRYRELGAGGCHYPAWHYTTKSVKVESVTSRSKFRLNTTDLPSSSDDRYNYGWVEWRSGDNWGLRAQVRDFTNSTREVTLYLPMPFDIATTDYMDIGIGCDFMASTCKDKYSNLLFFGGDPWTPGTDKMLQTPQE